MKVLNAEQIKEWDQYTIQMEPISSIDLMERAASKCVDWITENYHLSQTFQIFCGKGNNGGDGLAIARMLAEKGSLCVVHILEFGYAGTEDFQHNLERLHQTNVEIRFIQDESHFHPFNENELIIDALLGSGLNRPLDGLYASVVEHMNHSGCEIISIDIPSGLSVDQSSKSNKSIKAKHTLSFQCFKPAFLMSENEESTGMIHILDIGLHPGYYTQLKTQFQLLDQKMILAMKKDRKKFAHKGNFGHALLIAGSYGKMGAAVLASKACIRSGVGLLTCHIPGCGYAILQTSVPEAMVVTDFNSSYITKLELKTSQFNSIGVGPGIGTASETKDFMRQVLESCHFPMVLDADALNIISENKELLTKIPENSILTPHPKEFERLFGATANGFDRIELALQKAHEHKVVIILKGHNSFIATPDQKGYFNLTGNSGMATAGSGDVLTGIITGLLAQGHVPEEASMMGVFIHGLAGDMALKTESQESLIASDIVSSLGPAYRFLV